MLPYIASTQAYDKDRPGAINQSWHRARLARERQAHKQKLRQEATRTKSEIADMIEELREEQKASFNHGINCKCHVHKR